MRKIRCPYCGFSCRRHGKISAGTQRWYCSNCKIAFTSKNDHQLKDFNLFQEWLFGKNVQKEMPGKGRTFRRKISRFWIFGHYHQGLKTNMQLFLWMVSMSVRTFWGMGGIDGTNCYSEICCF